MWSGTRLDKRYGEDEAWGAGSVVALAHNLGKVTGGLSVNFVVGL
jgi:hypothetical protein